LNALAKKARQKAQNSASGFAGAMRPVAGAEGVADAIVAMTQDPLFSPRLFAVLGVFRRAETSFGPIH
jgi:hypothetical protein